MNNKEIQEAAFTLKRHYTSSKAMNKMYINTHTQTKTQKSDLFSPPFFLLHNVIIPNSPFSLLGFYIQSNLLYSYFQYCSKSRFLISS